MGEMTAPQTVLIVEDETSIASFVALYLKNAGYTVKAAGTGGAALNAIAAETPALIILDLNLPDMDGLEINPRELVARVKSVLRRSSPDRRRDEGEEIRHGDLVINAGRREVMVGDQEIQLAPKEFDLLWELLDHRGLVLTRDQLLERVWGYTFAGDTRTVDVHVRQVRRKLGDASPIVTVWGVGYKVSPERASAPAASS
jgi:DNA-binding response OmpR family regulator